MKPEHVVNVGEDFGFFGGSKGLGAVAQKALGQKSASPGFSGFGHCGSVIFSVDLLSGEEPASVSSQ